MQDLRTNINHLNELILANQSMEAFETYYHEDVIMQENNNPPTIGKSANREREKAFFSNITAFRSASVLHVAVGDGFTLVVWHYDYTHKEWGLRNYTQASVQTWKNGKIIKEQFFYGN